MLKAMCLTRGEASLVEIFARNNKSAQGSFEFSVPYPQIWINYSIRMLIKTSIGFFLSDEVEYPEIL